MKSIPKRLRAKLAFIAIREYAALSYLYYEKDDPKASDEEFDDLCTFILDNWKYIKPHDINGYLEKDSLLAGTGYNVKISGQTLDYAISLQTGNLKHVIGLKNEKPKKKRIDHDLA